MAKTKVKSISWWPDEKGHYEFEHRYDKRGKCWWATGWYRTVGGREADGLWPEWHTETKELRYG